MYLHNLRLGWSYAVDFPVFRWTGKRTAYRYSDIWNVRCIFKNVRNGSCHGWIQWGLQFICWQGFRSDNREHRVGNTAQPQQPNRCLLEWRWRKGNNRKGSICRRCNSCWWSLSLFLSKYFYATHKWIWQSSGVKNFFKAVFLCRTQDRICFRQ